MKSINVSTFVVRCVFTSILAVSALAVTLPKSGFAQEAATAASVDGVWRITNFVRTGANAATNANPQPSLIIFARGYYSFLSVNGNQARPAFVPAKDPNNLTDAEKIARYEQYNPFTAQAGTYDVNGTTLTTRPLVAKNVAVMTTNGPNVGEFKLEGNTLLLILRSRTGQPVSETRFTLTRVR